MSTIQISAGAPPRAPSVDTRGAPAPIPVAVPSTPDISLPAAPPADTNVTPASLQSAVDHANKTVQNLSSNALLFSIDKGTGIEVVKLTDQQTGEVIRQIPSKEMLEIAKSIEAMTGSLVSHQA